MPHEGIYREPGQPERVEYIERSPTFDAAKRFDDVSESALAVVKLFIGMELLLISGAFILGEIVLKARSYVHGEAHFCKVFALAAVFIGILIFGIALIVFSGGCLIRNYRVASRFKKIVSQIRDFNCEVTKVNCDIRNFDMLPSKKRREVLSNVLRLNERRAEILDTMEAYHE